MPAPRWLARFNLYVTNRILGPVATRMPGMGIVFHVGRKTHRRYRTPVMIFRKDDQVIIALTYGRESQWVQNVLAEGGCQLQSQGCMLRLTNPRLYHDTQRTAVPALHRFILGLLNVSDFLALAVVR